MAKGTNREYRAAALAASAEQTDNEMIVEGYAAVFEQPTVLFEYDGIQYKEVIDRNAFNGCDMSAVPFKYNHSNDFLSLAKTTNGTLQLSVDDNGLKVRASIAPTQAGSDLFALIKRGDISQMSFGFTVSQDSYDQKTHTRRVLQIDRLYDVSAVDLPAYDGTCISARDYFTAQQEAEAVQEKRQRLILLSMC